MGNVSSTGSPVRSSTDTIRLDLLLIDIIRFGFELNEPKITGHGTYDGGPDSIRF